MILSEAFEVWKAAVFSYLPDDQDTPSAVGLRNSFLEYLWLDRGLDGVDLEL